MRTSSSSSHLGAIAILVTLCACGRSANEPADWSQPLVSGCGDFFVVFQSADKTRALTVQVDRQGSGIGIGTTTVATQNATLKLDTYARPLSGEAYCTDARTEQQTPQTTTVKAKTITVTVPAHQQGDAYPLGIELKDVDLGGGVVLPSLTGSAVNVGWFAG